MGEEKNMIGLDKNSVALMRELKANLYHIARRAELGNYQVENIQASAEQSLRLIDSFLLSAQVEYGQTQLDLEPLCIGSVLHEVAHDLNFEARIEVKANQPVMTNRSALNGLLSAVGQVMGDISSDALILRSFIDRGGNVGVGVFAKKVELSAEDLKTSLELGGQAHMALARYSNKSGVMISVADNLARALGGSLEVKRMGSLRGFATILPRSDQLALI